MPEAEANFDRLYLGDKHFLDTAYPCWRYHHIKEPLLVKDAKEDEEARKQGYDDPMAPISANKQLMNWYWDLEDMSPKQLVVFAKDEFDVDLPIDAGQERLMGAVVELSRNSPQNRNRIVLMAHEIAMDYDASQREIRRMMEKEESETETQVFEL